MISTLHWNHHIVCSLRSRSIRLLSLVSWIGFALALFSGCNTSAQGDGSGVTDTRTNWLKVCDEDAECGTELECLCGVCTRECETSNDCVDLSETAECGTREGQCSNGLQICEMAFERDEPLVTEDGSVPDEPSNPSDASSPESEPISSSEPSTSSLSPSATASERPSVTASEDPVQPLPSSTTARSGGVGGSSNQPAPVGGGGTGGCPDSMCEPPPTMDAGVGGGEQEELPLGAICHDNAVSDEFLPCEVGFCDPATVCTDGIPSHCVSSCVCNGPGVQCRTVQSGQVTLDHPCCDGYDCVLNGAASSSDTEVYFCEEADDAVCDTTCEVSESSACASFPGAPILWLCEDFAPPDEVYAFCFDLATALPRWCCPETTLPQCQ